MRRRPPLCAKLTGWTHAAPSVQHAIIAAWAPDSIWLYESEPGVLANAQMAAMTERMETAPLRWLDLELLAQ